MGMPRSVRAGAVAVAGGVLLFVSGLLPAYAMQRNGYDTCAALPTPPSALPGEGGPGGYDVVLFPLSGLSCWWNTPEGSILKTFHLDANLTTVVLGSVLLVLLGAATIVVGLIRRNLRRSQRVAAGS